MPLYLVNSPDAEKFLTLANTNAGRRSMLGDADKFKGMGQTITDAHGVLQKGVERAVALVQDRTRTDVAKHAAAKQIAEATAKQLAFQRNQIAAKAKDLMQDGQAVADAFFEMRGERSAIDAQIMNWVCHRLCNHASPGRFRKSGVKTQFSGPGSNVGCENPGPCVDAVRGRYDKRKWRFRSRNARPVA